MEHSGSFGQGEDPWSEGLRILQVPARVINQYPYPGKSDPQSILTWLLAGSRDILRMYGVTEYKFPHKYP